jgi:hypothetical protein
MTPAPNRRSRFERGLDRLVRAAARVPGLRRIAMCSVVARSGYWFVTACAFLWGGILLGRPRYARGIHYYEGLPRWAYGRGGTTIGAIYLTTDMTADAVLDHEATHKAQWRRYGLAFIALYLAAGSYPLTNRFEVEAGLERGGYLPGRVRRS